MNAAEARDKRRRKRERRLRRKPTSKIPTAGMADIAFLLLIFFMLIVYEADRTVVELPHSEARSGSDEQAALVVLALGPGGPEDVVYKFTDGTSDSELVPNLAAIAAEAARVLAANPSAVFKIKADGKISARLVTHSFDTLSVAGAAKVLLLTDPPDETGSSS